MPKPKTKPPTPIDKLAQLEIMLADLQRDHAAATYHRDVLVEECIEKAHDDLQRVTDALLTQNMEEADRVSKVARVRINFAKRLLEADAVEHFLGESDYLDLSEASVSPAAKVGYYFVQLEQQLLQLYTEMKSESENT